MKTKRKQSRNEENEIKTESKPIENNSYLGRSDAQERNKMQTFSNFERVQNPETFPKQDVSGRF
jgi:hypothetical protein